MDADDDDDDDDYDDDDDKITLMSPFNSRIYLTHQQ